MASILIIDDNDAVRTALEVLLSLQGHRVLSRKLAGRGSAHAGEGGDRPRAAGHEFPQGGYVGRGGRRAVPCDTRALPDGSDRAAHCVDAPGNGRRSRQGRRCGLRGEAVGRRASADDDPQPAGAAPTVGRTGARGASPRRLARRARAEVRSVRARVRERADARLGDEGHAHREQRTCPYSSPARTAPARKCWPRSSRRTPACAAAPSSRSTSARCRRI